MNESTGQWLNGLGIFLALIGFFWQPLWMGLIAILLGLISLFFSKVQGLSWITIGLGLIVLIMGL